MCHYYIYYHESGTRTFSSLITVCTLYIYDGKLNTNFTLWKNSLLQISGNYQSPTYSPLIKNFNSKLPIICQIRYYQIFALWYFIKADRKNELIQNRKYITLSTIGCIALNLARNTSFANYAFLS